MQVQIKVIANAAHECLRDRNQPRANSRSEFQKDRSIKIGALAQPSWLQESHRCSVEVA
jgi:hypothetical protein